MDFSEWTKKDKKNGGYYECKVSLFKAHDPIMVIRFWESGPIVYRGYYDGKVDHMVGNQYMCSPLRWPVEKIKEKAIETAVVVVRDHLLMDLSEELKEVALKKE